MWGWVSERGPSCQDKAVPNKLSQVRLGVWAGRAHSCVPESYNMLQPFRSCDCPLFHNVVAVEVVTETQDAS